MSSRPNILFIMADQFRADTLGCAGMNVRTPNLDALAAEGVRFSQCATIAPLCVPARISLFTGKYPHTTGSWDNTDYVLSPEANIWSKEFRGLGYATALFGKTHLHGDSTNLIDEEYLINGYGFDTVNEINGPHSSTWSTSHMTEYWKSKGVYDTYCQDMNSRGKAPIPRPSPLPLEDYYDVYVGQQGKKYLQEYQGDKPWFCHVSFSGPHEPWDTPEPYASMYDPAEMPVPVPRMTHACTVRPTGEADRLMQKLAIQCSPEQASMIRADYFGGVTLIDQQIGQIIDTIKARGEWDNTIVLFTSDHGEMNGDHGFVNKRNFLSGALLVPLIIRTPETVKKGGKVVNSPVSLMDVGPTLVELSGGKLDYIQFGRSLCPILQGETDRVREYVLSEYLGEIMYMDDQWKMVINCHGQVYLLFDRVNDPLEQRNLAGAPEFAEVAAVLREKMMLALAENRCLKPSVLQIPRS